MKKLAKIIIPYLYDGFLIISLRPEWLCLFGKIPVFEFHIKARRLHIISEEF